MNWTILHRNLYLFFQIAIAKYIIEYKLQPSEFYSIDHFLSET